VTITESSIKRLLFDDSVVPVLPFLHQMVEECKSRILSHKARPGCPGCKGEVYLDDLIAKTVSMLSSLDENNKAKFKKFIKAKDDVFLVTKENGTIRKKKIA